jgi:hypothetical protein
VLRVYRTIQKVTLGDKLGGLGRMGNQRAERRKWKVERERGGIADWFDLLTAGANFLLAIWGMGWVRPRLPAED